MIGSLDRMALDQDVKLKLAEIEEFALNLKQNFANVFQTYMDSENEQNFSSLFGDFTDKCSSFDGQDSTVVRLNDLVLSVENATDWIEHYIHPADRRSDTYFNAIYEGINYLEHNLPKTLDNRLLNSTPNHYRGRLHVDRSGEMYGES